MDILTLKLDLIQQILNSNSTALLFKTKTILQTEADEDRSDQLTRQSQDIVFEGINDYESR